MLIKVGFTVAGLTVFDIYGVVTNTMRSTVLSCENGSGALRRYWLVGYRNSNRLWEERSGI